MKTAKKTILSLVVLSLALLLPATAPADWIPEDGHKMHHPQLPNEDGWDIDMTNYVLADDWQCSESGPVSDIHFWYSVEGDEGEGTEAYPAPHFATVDVTIYGNVPAGANANPNYSHPGDTVLWTGEFSVDADMVAGPWQGLQGWDDPELDSDCVADDHVNYWQLNITNIIEPYTQTAGEIYWLALEVSDPTTDTSQEGASVGWKTTYEIFAFEDDAVYLEDAGAWAPIEVCTENYRRDLAFVITPEPATLLVLALGLIPALLKRRRRRIV